MLHNCRNQHISVQGHLLPCNKNYARFQASTTMQMRYSQFWGITQEMLEVVYPRFGGPKMLVNNYQHMLHNNTEDRRPFLWVLHQQAVWAKDRLHWSNTWKQKQRLLFPWFLALLTLQLKMLPRETNLQYYGILMCNVGQPRWVQHFNILWKAGPQIKHFTAVKKEYYPLLYDQKWLRDLMFFIDFKASFSKQHRASVSGTDYERHTRCSEVLLMKTGNF